MVVVLLLSSCIPNFLDEYEQPEKLYYKMIEVPDFKLEWYYHSLITSTTPNYVVLSKDGQTDTICMSDNIHDINVYIPDTIKLIFYGLPKKRQEYIDIDEKILGCFIIVDTTAIRGEYTFRKSFKKRKNKNN